jgi:hypothetical protein
MSSAPSVTTLHDRLPGTWTVKATNFPMWLKGDKLNPTFSFGVVSEQPWVLTDTVRYTTEAGEQKSIVGIDRETTHGFVWRGKGLNRIFTSHWSVSGASPDGNVLVVRFEKTLVTPAGLDVIVREGVEVHELRATVARNTQHFGLEPEDLASLSWL